MNLNVRVVKTETGFVATSKEFKIFGQGRSIYEALDVFQTNLELSPLIKDGSDVSLKIIFEES